MRRRQPPPIFFDLDETLIHAAEPGCLPDGLPFRSRDLFDYTVLLRPEAKALLDKARARGREVYLFTHANFGYALEVSQQFELGFDESSIFSFSMILNCRKGLCPEAVLIDNKRADDEDTKIKIDALGIRAEQVWIIPSFEPPQFQSAKLFSAGFEWRLAQLDRH